MGALDAESIVTFTDAPAWEAWLARNHAQPAGVWLQIAKKGSGRTTVTVAEALDVALCYGWIDGQRRGLDETYFLQRYSPRRPRSTWSQVNVAKVAALIAAGRMREPGLAEVAAAKADGRWERAYVSQREATTPPDLAAALERSERARTAFGSLGKSDRYNVILRVVKAATPERRAARLREEIARLER